MALPKKATAPAVVGLNIGSLDFYTGGGGLPEGDYALEFNAQMFQATDAKGVTKGPFRLGVMVTAHPLSDPSPEAVKTQFYSMGTSAHLSFAPNPETGKGVVAVPGGPASTLNNSTNWAILIKSLYDSGLPQGVFTNDFTVIDGIHVHMQHQAEPVERAGFQSKTAEFTEDRKPGSIAVVTEIKEDGKPWDGSGGIPEAVAPAKTAGKVAPKAATKAAAKAPAAEVEDEVLIAAQSGITSVLEKKPNGCPKLALRTGCFMYIKDALKSVDMAQAVIDTYFGTDEALESVVSQLGYTVDGPMVKPA